MSGNLGGIQSYNAQFAQLPAGVVPYLGVPTITLGHLKNINPDLKWEIKTRLTLELKQHCGRIGSYSQPNTIILRPETCFITIELACHHSFITRY